MFFQFRVWDPWEKDTSEVLYLQRSTKYPPSPTFTKVAYFCIAALPPHTLSRQVFRGDGV